VPFRFTDERKDLHSETPVESFAIECLIELLHDSDLHLEDVRAVAVVRDNPGVELVAQESCRLTFPDYPGDQGN
jgi:hypothetical protein